MEMVFSNSGFSPEERIDQIQNASVSVASSSSSNRSFNSVNGLSYVHGPLANEYEQTRAKYLASYEECLKEEPRIGLRLTKSPALVEFFERNLNAAPPATNNRSSQPMIQSAVENKEKKKALHVPISVLQIGNFTKVSTHDGHLVAKCYYARSKVMWEILEGNLKNKIEFKWENILSLQAKFGQNGRGTLIIELKERPSFFHEMNPKPRKHTNWESSWDFTGNQASTHRIHVLGFSSDFLKEFYTKLIESDSRLNELSKGPCPTHSSPYFTSNGFDVRVSSTHAPPPLHVAHQLGNRIQSPTIVQVSPLHGVIKSQRVEDPADHLLLHGVIKSQRVEDPADHLLRTLPHFPSSGYAAFPSNVNNAHGSLSHSHFPSDGHDASGSQSYPHFLSDGHDAFGSQSHTQLSSNDHDTHGSQSHPHFLYNEHDAYGYQSHAHDAHGYQSHPHFLRSDHDAYGYQSHPHDAHGSQSHPHFSSDGHEAYGSQSHTHFPSDGHDAYGSLLHPHFSSNGHDVYGSQSHLHFPSNGNDAPRSLTHSHFPSNGNDEHESPSHPHYGSPHPRFHSNGYEANGSFTCTPAPLQTIHQVRYQMQPITPVKGIDDTISSLHKVLFYNQRLEDPNLIISRDSATSSSVNASSTAAFEALGNKFSDFDTNSKVEVEPAQNVNTNRCHGLTNASQEQQNPSTSDANANFHSYRQLSGVGRLIRPPNFQRKPWDV